MQAQTVKGWPPVLMQAQTVKGSPRSVLMPADVKLRSAQRSWQVQVNRSPRPTLQESVQLAAYSGDSTPD
jgi:hypothetical protein